MKTKQNEITLSAGHHLNHQIDLEKVKHIKFLMTVLGWSSKWQQRMLNNDIRRKKARRVSIKKIEWNCTHRPLISLRVRLCIMQKNQIFEQSNHPISLIRRIHNKANLITCNKRNVWLNEKWWLKNQKLFESNNIQQD